MTTTKKERTELVKPEDYEDVGVCIRTEQVPPSTVAHLFQDEKFLAYYKKQYQI